TNLPRTGTTTGTGCRGRPPKIRKEIPIQSTNMDEPSITPMNLLNTSGGSTGSSYTVGAVKRDDDEHHAVTVLCSSDELYTLGQDMCVSCGSFGLDEEGRLISCTQCGQSYHSYCAGLNKLSKVILKQGWRCLDCTVCEGCGKPTDESRLLLCDDCDISYHTYCLQPPLDQVPKGNWKCQWCVRCVKCGSTNPGPAGSCCLWENNYTECAPCHSLINCPACAKPYRSDELIVQCTLCDRWLHGSCEHILSEDSILSTTGDFIYHDTVNRFLIKKATKLALAVKEEQRQQPIVSVPTPSNALPQPVITAADDETDMQAILDNEEFCNFVEYMMNSSKTTQDPMLPLCGPTDIEDFLEFIEHPETHNELQAVDLLNNSNSTNQNVSISNENNTVQVIQSHQTTMITTTASSHHPTNSQVPLATPTSNLVVMATNVNDNSKQIINNLAREMMESTGLHTTTTSSILSQGNIQNTGLIVKQE
ncbi:unnamed protein product, partial [Rotaria magnacalcarata]